MNNFKIKLVSLLIIFNICGHLSAQVGQKQVLFTKKCDTVSVDSMVCIKCTNRELTMNCRRYACAIHGDCIPMGPVIVNGNRLKDARAPQTTTKKK
ncbi:MAG: hypothetical protein U0V49_00820 [Saprospiraceae bacterium]